MMLFLDTEFNGLGGEMISMALVSEDGREFYEVVNFDDATNAWVEEHVLPKRGKDPISNTDFFEAFSAFIGQFHDCEVIADWPADFEHFSHWLTNISADRDFSIPIECTMRLVRGDDTIAPTIPHNALSDARALCYWFMRAA